jgi:DNA-directed RNA polymerase specialized sigma subunit
MKIALNMSNGTQSSKEAQAKLLEREVLAAKKGDWNAKSALVRTFMPLLHSLSEKRCSTNAEINRLIEAGKNGVFAAARKYKPGTEGERFQIFAVSFIEKEMDREQAVMRDEQSPRPRGFFARLFGR